MDVQVRHILARRENKAHAFEVGARFTQWTPIDAVPGGDNENLVEKLVDLVAGLVKRNE